jgi:1-acyl-sn-glycerol-3-phosphate acyltransferase
VIAREGGLLKGRTGTAYLASAAGVPVIPVAAWGQEKALHQWMRLKRAPVTIRIGQPIRPASGRNISRDLEAQTEIIMLALAGLLPAEYRGYYREAARTP